MSTDTEITRSLHEAADRAAVPPLDIDALRAGGRRHARRRQASVLGAAALVLAVIGGGVLVGTDPHGSAPTPGPVKRDDNPAPKVPQTPRTVADLPVGDAPGLPYLRGDVLYTGESATELDGPGRLMGLRHGGAVTLGWDADLGVVEIGPRGSQRLLDADATGYPAVSPDGHWAAWPVTTEGEDARVVVWSFETGRAADGFAVPEQPQCCDSGFRVAGVADDGTVYVSGDEAHYVVDGTGGEVRAIEGLDPSTDTIVVSSDGLVVLSAPTAKDGDGRATLGEVVQGRFRSDTELTGPDVSGSSWWSPYAAGVTVSRSPAGGIRTYALDGDVYETPEPITVPTDVDVTGVVWESAKAILVDVVEDQDDHAWWLRCSLENRTCERAADLGAGDTVILPTR